MNDIFAGKKKRPGLRNSNKNIRHTLRLFGQEDQQKPYFISSGAGISRYPAEGFRADFYIYAICFSGTAELLLNNEPVHLRTNSFFAAIPSTIVQVVGHSPDFRARVLVFEKSFLLKNILDARQLEQLGFFSFDTLAFVQLKKKESQLLQGKLDALHLKTRQDGLFQEQLVQNLIFNLLYETAEIFVRYHNTALRKALGREEELFLQFMKLVQFHFREEQGLDFYAGKLFIGSKYLIQVCKKIAGKTPGTLIAAAMSNEACLLLKQPDNTISMVAARLNYGSVAAFSKFFRKQTGVSPSAYRNNH
ncbi:MAG: AraC family transcriptional regulator [Candidatus Pseudobacter hemicellulosilyticus]|uniref:AraC family transcriptional regulator n=1 Tax=Candidatus Pseudobacter hemicellulosilyticus TaxID=3121375 RepID=A0AAJ5WWI6_9BACT|nr:MAG: AraC family transcriptional regulator [Pseudobacter sp.]